MPKFLNPTLNFSKHFRGFPKEEGGGGGDLNKLFEI